MKDAASFFLLIWHVRCCICLLCLPNLLSSVASSPVVLQIIPFFILLNSQSTTSCLESFAHDLKTAPGPIVGSRCLSHRISIYSIPRSACRVSQRSIRYISCNYSSLIIPSDESPQVWEFSISFFEASWHKFAIMALYSYLWSSAIWLAVVVSVRFLWLRWEADGKSTFCTQSP